jgi:hypothetical protein
VRVLIRTVLGGTMERTNGTAGAGTGLEPFLFPQTYRKPSKNLLNSSRSSVMRHLGIDRKKDLP